MKPGTGPHWLNRTVLGIGLASLFSDWSHEIATTVMPAFLATMGVAAAWLGLIEGVSDGLTSFAKMASGFYTDRLTRRKPIAVAGYVITVLGTAAFGLATSAWHVLLARAGAWLGRGVRTPVRKALLAGSVTKETYGCAFGFERMMDTLGAIVGPATAFALLPLLHHHYPTLFALTLIPGMLAVALIAFVVKERGLGGWQLFGSQGGVTAVKFRVAFVGQFQSWGRHIIGAPPDLHLFFAILPGCFGLIQPLERPIVTFVQPDSVLRLARVARVYVC